MSRIWMSFLRKNIPNGVHLADKWQIKKCKTLNFKEAEPDFMIFRCHKGKQRCHVVELKDGHVFDTKKATKERDNMYEFVKYVKQQIPDIKYKLRAHFCAFNQNNPEHILSGFKHRIKPEEAMTGQKICQLLGINYEDIVTSRQADCPDNFECFLSELTMIASVRKRLLKLLRD